MHFFKEYTGDSDFFNRSFMDILNRSVLQRFFRLKLYTIIMPKQKHRVCNHTNAQIKMQRIYARQDSTFVPVGWYCPDCKQMVRD